MAGQDDGGQERTHEPTQKRIQEYRDKGQVPKSQEVLTAAGLTFGSAVMLASAPRIATALRDVFHFSYQQVDSQTLTHADFETMSLTLLTIVGWAVLPPMLLMWFLLAMVGTFQQRGAFPKEPFKFQPEKFNPVTAFKEKYFSWEPVMQLVKGLLKLLLIGWLVWSAVFERLGFIPAFATQAPVAALVGLEEVAYLVLTRAIPVAILVAILDYGYNWRKLYEQMKMTKEELKEEMKSLEGDPHMKSARKRRAQELAFSRTLQDVPKADVVITNPTHYAIALRYRKEENDAPVVIAKGVDAQAERIKAKAREHDIQQIENRPLARALFDRVATGKPIPEDLYSAVAKILAIVWKRRGKVRPLR